MLQWRGIERILIDFLICVRCDAGPVVAEAMFVNREEVPVHPVYRDPVSLCPSVLLILAM